MCPSQTPGASKLSRTVSPSGTGPDSPSMPLSCRPSRGLARPTLVLMSSLAVLSLPQRAGSDIKPTLNSPAPGDAALSLSASRLAAGLALRPCSSCACSRDIRRRLFLPWVARWSGLLAVAAQRAFAASLLELPPAAELGEGPEPELHELLAETRWDHA